MFLQVIIIKKDGTVYKDHTMLYLCVQNSLFYV